jgi:hypothetical protein
MRWIWVILIGSLFSGAAAADPYRRGPYVAAMPPGPEGVGCVWYRQRLDCSRYCYWEVNGRRYCRERPREAYPQAIFEEYFLPSEPSMKLGAQPARR